MKKMIRIGGKCEMAGRKVVRNLPRGIILRTSSSVNRRCEEHNHTFFLASSDLAGDTNGLAWTKIIVMVMDQSMQGQIPTEQ
jgi:hypothetical protein